MSKALFACSMRFAAAAIALSASVMIGCGDDNTAASSATAPTGGANLANKPIDATNAATVYASASQAIGNAIAAVFTQAAKKPTASPALAKSFSGLSVNGKNSGKVTASGDYNATASEVSMTSKITFDNFSDDGKLFIGGILDISYRVPMANLTGLTFTYKGDLAFAGDYKGTMGFDISYSATKASGSYTAGGQTIRF
jgi:hypothetical protein